MGTEIYHIYLNADEQKQIIISLLNLKNRLIEQGKYTDAVDDILCKVLSAKKRKIKKITISRYRGANWPFARFMKKRRDSQPSNIKSTIFKKL